MGFVCQLTNPIAVLIAARFPIVAAALRLCLQGMLDAKYRNGDGSHDDRDRNQHDDRTEMIACVVSGLEHELQIVADRYDREPFHSALDFDLRGSVIRHGLDLSGVLILDLDLDACLQQVEQVHRGA